MFVVEDFSSQDVFKPTLLLKYAFVFSTDFPLAIAASFTAISLSCT